MKNFFEINRALAAKKHFFHSFILSLFMSAIMFSFAACGDEPEGAIKGKFTVGEGKQVYFAKGNLQATYNRDTEKWKLAIAENQWDIVNMNVDDHIRLDLFGWSTLSTDYGISESKQNSDYSGKFEEWGNAIGNGWRTLKGDEWNYLLRQRPRAEELFALGNIVLDELTAIYGLIILPDNWQKPVDVSFTPSTQCEDQKLGKLVWDESTSRYINSKRGNYDHNTYTLAQWSKMEDAGAVFLPAAGYRNGKNLTNVHYDGNYWASDSNAENKANMMYFTDEILKPAFADQRLFGQAVRLVQDVK